MNGGFVSWDTFVIYKDNAGQRDYLFTELVSAFGGTDAALIQPPFAILPREDQGGGALAGGVQQQDFVIENVPFGMAIPMLTGWELSYLTDDQHVKDVGVWIEDWSYTTSPTGGTLRYRLASILADDDNWPPHVIRHRVTLLGIRALGGGLPATQRAPQPPAGGLDRK